MATALFVIQRIWSLWDIQFYVLLSLFLQGVLLVSAYVRKRTAANLAVNLVSSAYFLAELLIPYALGIISARHANGEGRLLPAKLDLLAFWAPFLLLHLGGPDNITSLSFDKNETWLKDFVRLVSHVYVVGRIFTRSLPDNTFLLPTALVFFAGFIKSVERTRALYLARPDNWENSNSERTQGNPGPDYEKLSESHLGIMKEAHLLQRVRTVQVPPKKFTSLYNIMEDYGVKGNLPDDIWLLLYAHSFYENFKGFVGGGGGGGGVSFSNQQRLFTRDFFLKRNCQDVYKLIEMELSFIHEALHTKAVAVQNQLGLLIRVMSTSSIFVASLFFFRHDKSGILEGDIRVTYALVLGALLLEFISVLMLLFSERNVIAFKYYNWAKPVAAAIVNRRRWSEAVMIFNLISYCIPDAISCDFTKCWFIWGFVAAIKATFKWGKGSITEYAKDEIFKELKKKSEIAGNVETAARICSQRGDWVLMQSSCYNQLKWSLGEVEYGKSLLLWHIATDLCCSKKNDGRNEQRDFCKTISDYMVYLLVLNPIMVTPKAGSYPQIMRDTCAEAQRFFKRRSARDHQQACEMILAVKTDDEIKPAVLKGDASKSVLFEASRLAKQLSNLFEEEEKQWELMSRVWVELLSYAAINCEAAVHAQYGYLRGELLTSVWLLMNRLGLGEQFRDEPAAWTRYKLVVK